MGCFGLKKKFSLIFDNFRLLKNVFCVYFLSKRSIFNYQKSCHSLSFYGYFLLFPSLRSHGGGECQQEHRGARVIGRPADTLFLVIYAHACVRYINKGVRWSTCHPFSRLLPAIHLSFTLPHRYHYVTSETHRNPIHFF